MANSTLNNALVTSTTTVVGSSYVIPAGTTFTIAGGDPAFSIGANGTVSGTATADGAILFTGNTGSVVTYTGAGSLILSGAEMKNNNAGASALIVNGGSVSLTDGDYSLNTCATAAGGVINNIGQGHTLTLKQSENGTLVFSGNSASYGGAVYVHNKGTMNQTGGTYTCNSATNNAGALVATGRVTLTNVNFDHNSAGGNGGAVTNGYYWGPSTEFLNQTGGSYTSNTGNFGGAIFTDGKLIQTDVTYSGNRAKSRGGAIYSDRNSATTIISGTGANKAVFVSNTAVAEGGAIGVAQGSMTVRNAVFSGNSAGTNGGAVWNVSETIISGSIFSSNSAGTNGGAIYNAKTLTMSQTADAALTFSGNYAAAGGAVANIGAAANLTQSGGTYAGNSATNGGAVYTYNSATMTQSGVTYAGNSASNLGGALWTLGSTTLTNVNFTSNRAGNQGGAVLAGRYYGTEYLNQTGGTYSGNYSVKQGGAIANDAVATLTDVHFIGNSAGGAAGALYNNRAGMAVLNVSGTTSGAATFVGNSAVGGGGAIQNVAGTLNVSGVVFSANHGDVGGAIYNLDAATISGCVFSANSSVANGGAIYNTKTLTITDTVFTENVAPVAGSRWGGAIYNGANGDLTLCNVTFNGNTAAYGGAIYNDSGKVTVTGKITLCTASDKISSNKVFTITTEAFGEGDFHLVVDDQAEGTHSALYDADRFASDDTSKYTLAVYDNDLYLKSATANFTTAVISVKGDVSSAEVAGVSYSGVAYTYSQVDLAKGLGATTIVYVDGLPDDERQTVSAGPVVVAKSDELKDLTYAGNGGAVEVQGSAVLEDMTFSGNSATGLGGAIYGSGKLTLNQSESGTLIFSGNSAAAGGAIGLSSGTAIGSLTQTGGTYVGNSATNGGAVYLHNKPVLVQTNVTYSANSATNNAGALTTIGRTTLTNVDFDHNSAGGKGGAVYNGYYWGPSTEFLNQTGGSYTSNTGNFGGAIFTDGKLIQTDVTYSGNRAKSRGGAIYSDRNSATTIISGTGADKAVFVSNTAVAEGGAIGVATGSMTVRNAVFSGNSAGTEGGAVWNVSETIISGSIFSSNSAGTDGGAIYNAKTLTMSQTADAALTFSGNSATGQGGAVANVGAGANLTQSGGSYVGNSATGGGAVYAHSSATLIQSGVSYTGNTATTGNGGAMRVLGYTTLTDVDFTGNRAGNFGGAVTNGLYYGNEYLTQSGGTYAGNYAANHGGAIYNDGTLTTVDVHFVGNSAHGGGGAIYANRATPVLAVTNVSGTALGAATFVGNSAVGGGGAIDNYAGTLNVSGVVFSANIGDVGGAIYNNGSAVVSGSVFSSNSSVAHGGAVYNLGTMTIADAVFTANDAPKDNGRLGGAIYNGSNGVLTLGNVTFNGNTAFSGGAIYNLASSVAVKGKITLMTATDTIATSGDFLIDGSAFGTGSYYTVVDAAVSGLYDNTRFKMNAETQDDYTVYYSGNNVYIRDNAAELPSAIITENGTATSVTVNGVEYTGTAYDFEASSLPKQFGATTVIYSGYEKTGKMEISSASTEGNVIVGLKNSHITGENKDNPGYVYGASAKTNVIGGNFTFEMENTTIEDYTANNGRLYTAGAAAVSGTITANVKNSTLAIICPTAFGSNEEEESYLNVAAMVTNLTDTTVTKEVRGTGSDATYVTVGSATINLYGTNTLGKITGCYGNKVTGSVALNVKSGVSTVSGAITNVDTITIDAGAELIVGNTVTVYAKENSSITNNGTFTWDCTKSGNAPTVTDWSKFTNNGTLTASVSADAFGTYVLANNASGFSGTITVKSGSETIATIGTGYHASGNYFLGLNADDSGNLSLSVASAIVDLSVNDKTISWNAVTGASKYLVSYSENNGTSWTTVETTETTYTYGGSAGNVQFKVQVSDGTNAGNASVLLSASADLGTAAANAKAGDKIQLSSGTYTGTSAITVGAANVALIGQGTQDTIVSKAIYAAGNAVTVANLTASTNVAGGAVNAAVTSGTDLNVGSALLKDAFAGSLVKTDSATVTAATAAVSGTTFRNLYGAGYATGSGVTLNNTSGVELNVSGGCTTVGGSGCIYGAGRVASGATLSAGTVEVNVDNGTASSGTLGGLYAGGYANGASVLNVASTNVAVKSGVFAKFVAAGVQVYGSGTTGTAASTNLVISGGEFNNAVLGASYAAGGATASVTTATTTISGGTFQTYVAGGGYANASTLTVGSVDLTISGGKFVRYVFGGNLGTAADETNASVTGQVHLTLDASTDTKIEASAIYAGSLNGSVGSTLVELKGEGSNLSFSHLYGSKANPTEQEDGVNGTKTLYFNGFSGELSGKLYQFDVFTMSGSTVEFAKAQDLTAVSTWNLDLTGTTAASGSALINWSNGGANDFADDAMSLTFDTASVIDLLVIDGTDTELDLATSDMKSVTLNTVSAEMQDNGSWMATVEGVDWYLKNNKTTDGVNNLVLSRIA